MLKNTLDSYGSVAKFLHWLIALLILTVLAVGFIMTGLPKTPDTFRVIGWHKSLGITVLTLVALRLLWKSMNIYPALPAALSMVEKLLAHLGHGFLYALMIAMPLSGWMMSSAAGFTVSVFGWFLLPNLVAPDPALKRTLVELHGTLAWALIGMIALHVLAALLHHFYYKDDVLLRMLPFVKRRNHAPDN